MLFYLLIFIDKCSGCIVYHALLTGVDLDSLYLVAHTTIEKVRKYPIAKPVVNPDNGSSFISMECFLPDLSVE